MNTPLLATIDAHTAAPWMALFITTIIIVAIWDAVWKLIALWKSARHSQLAWFVCLAVFNTAGILPILYILCFQKKAPDQLAQ
jgi:hypothetical protein